MRREDLMNRINGLVKYYGPKIDVLGQFSAYDDANGLFYGDFADDWKYPVIEGHEVGFADTTIRENGKKGWLYTYDGIYMKDFINDRREIPFAGIKYAYIDKQRIFDRDSNMGVIYENGDKVIIDSAMVNKTPFVEFIEKVTSLLKYAERHSDPAARGRLAELIKEKIEGILPENYFITFCTDYDRESGTWTDEFEEKLDGYFSRFLMKIVDSDDEDDYYDEYEDEDYDDDFYEDNVDTYKEIYRKHLEKMFRSFNGTNILAIVDNPDTISIKNKGVRSTGFMLTNEDFVKYDIENIPISGEYFASSIQYVPYKDIKGVRLSESTKQNSFSSFSLFFEKKSVAEDPDARGVVIDAGRFPVAMQMYLRQDQANSLAELLRWLRENTH